MKKKYTAVAMALAAASLIGASAAYAIPTLQLDIEGGTYDPVTETVLASGTPFILDALLIPDQDTLVGLQYYISAAIVPKVLEPGADLGSFTFGGVTVDVTDDMTFGTPPIATVDKDLASHGIFETYYAEFAFNVWDGTNTPYNTQYEPGTLFDNIPGTGSYYHRVEVDVSGLTEGYVVHFDLYTYGDLPGGNDKTGITEFAPFSHDAQSGPGSNPIPEPATMLLFGTGLAGLAGLARRKKE